MVRSPVGRRSDNSFEVSALVSLNKVIPTQEGGKRKNIEGDRMLTQTEYKNQTDFEAVKEKDSCGQADGGTDIEEERTRNFTEKECGIYSKLRNVAGKGVNSKLVKSKSLGNLSKNNHREENQCQTDTLIDGKLKKILHE